MSPTRRTLLALATAVGLTGCGADTPQDPTGAAGGALASTHPTQAAAPGDPQINRQLDELRRATARFQNFDAAKAAGYDVPITPCWESRSKGAMGYHYGKVDPSQWSLTVDLLDPTLLIYEPGPGGHMKLVGMEYVVPRAAWDAAHPGTAPALLGQSFMPHSALPIYKLHVWLWRDNPNGLFADWNPQASCRFAAEAQYFD